MGQLVGLYPGTFDPVTNGHIDVIDRAMKLVDELVIGVATSAGKGPMFSLEERIAIVEAETASLTRGKIIRVRPLEGLLMHFAQEVGAHVIVRGLRAVVDFEYEFQMTAINHHLNSEIETVFFMADPKHQAIASSLVKEVARLGGDISHFVTPGVAAHLKRKLEL